MTQANLVLLALEMLELPVYVQRLLKILEHVPSSRLVPQSVRPPLVNSYSSTNATEWQKNSIKWHQ